MSSTSASSAPLNSDAVTSVPAPALAMPIRPPVTTTPETLVPVASWPTRTPQPCALSTTLSAMAFPSPDSIRTASADVFATWLSRTTFASPLTAIPEPVPDDASWCDTSLPSTTFVDPTTVMDVSGATPTTTLSRTTAPLTVTAMPTASECVTRFASTTPPGSVASTRMPGLPRTSSSWQNIERRRARSPGWTTTSLPAILARLPVIQTPTTPRLTVLPDTTASSPVQVIPACRTVFPVTRARSPTTETRPDAVLPSMTTSSPFASIHRARFPTTTAPSASTSIIWNSFDSTRTPAASIRIFALSERLPRTTTSSP